MMTTRTATHRVTSYGAGELLVTAVRDDANNRNMLLATVVSDMREGQARAFESGATVWVARAQVHALPPVSAATR
ncbi:MAG TPA: hypothetical protein VJ851_00720 [Jatrophihabitans sp.]|nr:hypothetical protein [Jatrophihabitans sp.]